MFVLRGTSNDTIIGVTTELSQTLEEGSKLCLC